MGGGKGAFGGLGDMGKGLGGSMGSLGGVWQDPKRF